MAKSRFEQLRRQLGASRRGASRRNGPSSVLLVALGAAAGVALGMVIADRAGGIEGLLRKAGARRGRMRTGAGGGDDALDGLPGWRHDEGRDAPRATPRPEGMRDLEDDDSELAPESIAHMHVRSRTPEAGSARPLPEWATRGRSPRDAAGVGDQDVSRADNMRELAVHHTPDEAELEARVLEAFVNDPILRERAIDICASGTGTIELTGWVHASAEISHALTLARGVPDVTGVVDRLAVRGAAMTRDHSGHRYAGPPPGTDAPRAD